MNDYERYDFWHREMQSVVPEKKRTMKRLIDSNRRFDDKIAADERRSEYIDGYAVSIINNVLYYN